ncbi:MAG: CoA transferase, partial [Rhodoplanes sp.]
MPPLTGIKVLDFSTLLPGPLASLVLAEAGAVVTKVERPGGDEMRHYAGPFGEASANFALLNRGKASLCLDLKSPDDRKRLDPYLAGADILIEQFRPGVMERMGLGYDRLRAINPGLIYCSISGYGQDGP